MFVLVAAMPTAALANSQRCATGIAPKVAGTIAEQLGSKVAAARFEDMSAQVVERTKWIVLDNLATLIYTSQIMKADAYLVRARERGGKPEARLWGTNIRLPVEDAAAGNAWLIHAAETDDTDHRASLRASPVVMGPALAMAEAQSSSGKDFLLSLAVGYTVLGRLAEPLGPLQLKGYMSSGVWGPPAAAAVSAKLRHLDAAQSANAIAIAASASGGSFQYYYDQTEEKRLIVARAARAGVEAAYLACHGEKGAERIFEGEAGLYRLFGEPGRKPPTAETIVKNFARLEGPLRLAPKFHAASASIIPFLDALAPIVAARGLTAADVDHFIVRGNADAAKIYAAKLAVYHSPPTQIGAKTSLAFTIALYLTKGSADAFDFTPLTLADPAINALAVKGRFEHIDSPETNLVLVLKSGEQIVITPFQSDGKSNEPEMREARLAKFKSLTRDTLTDDQRRRLIEMVWSLDAAHDMAIWLRAVDKILLQQK